MNQALLVAKNLGRRKLRTGLMLLALLIAFFLYGCLESFDRAFYASQNSAADNRLVSVNKVNFTLPLPISYGAQIGLVPGVSAVSYQSWFGGYYQDPRQFLIMFASDPAGYLAVYPNLQVTPAERTAWLADRTGLLVGRTVATKYHWHVGDHVPISSNIYTRAKGSHTWDFTISGMYSFPTDPAREGQVNMRHDNFDETVTNGRDTSNMVMFTTKSAALNEAVIKRIDTQFANSPYETTTDTAAAFNRAFASQLGNIALIIRLVLISAFAAILLIVGNTMVMAVRERTREIGVLKTLGFSGTAIMMQILAESMLLSVTGALLGLAVAGLLITGLKDVIAGFAPGMHLAWQEVVGALGWAVVLGLATGGLPAWSGLKLRIATALGRI